MIEAVNHFCSMYSVPVIADPASGIRFGYAQAIGSYETFLRKETYSRFKPETIIRVGNVPISKWLNEFITEVQPQKYYHFALDGEWSDDNHLITHFVQRDGWSLLHSSALIPGMREPKKRNNYAEELEQVEKTTWQVIDHEIENGAYFDGAIVYDVVELIPDGSTLFAGNSLPVRHLDQFGRPTTKRIYTYANRGASGIDGNISSALGAGAARPDKPLVAVVGDITFYHDMNGLLAVQRCGVPVTIVLLNNDGGGIFNRLPIKNFEPEFTDYFLTPHGLDFSHAAKIYGLDYILVDAYSDNARDSFRQAFSERVGSGQSTIIEVRTDSRKDETRRQEIVAAVHARLKELNL